MYTVDCIDREWYIMQPNSGGRACARCHYEADARMIADALSEVAQLHAENERLRAALEDVVDGSSDPYSVKLARAALGKGAA